VPKRDSGRPLWHQFDRDNRDGDTDGKGQQQNDKWARQAHESLDRLPHGI
jgi:hypothetical protein